MQQTSWVNSLTTVTILVAMCAICILYPHVVHLHKSVRIAELDEAHTW